MKNHLYLSADEGVNTIPNNPCSVIDFQTVRLTKGSTHSASSGDREMLAVVLGGKVAVTVGDAPFRPSVAARTSSPASLTRCTSRAATTTPSPPSPTSKLACRRRRVISTPSRT